MEALRVAIVHYHLRPGGVTRVIHHAVSALKHRDVRVVVLTGEPPRGTAHQAADFQVIPDLRYGPSATVAAPEALARELEIAATRALGAQPDIWHFHNHSLGKNLSVPHLVHHLARLGRRLLLQVHDFAEDGRPGNYRLLLNRVGNGDTGRLAARLYPLAPHVHYAVLNRRDQAFLALAGVPEAQLHHLPNAVCIEPARQSASGETEKGGRRLFVYPTRAIRRKNIGEFLLWSAAADADDRFAVTLAPKNPAARPIYEQWERFAQSVGLPVAFDTCGRGGRPFGEVIAEAHALVTTSIAEGFGLAFLEPWLAGRPLAGRNLPEITADFEAAGVDLSGLYKRLDVPLEWIGKEALRRTIRRQLTQYLHAYGRESTPDAAERAFSAFVKDAGVDFGRLDEGLQESVIRRVRGSPEARRHLRPVALEPPGILRDRVQRNEQTILRAFGLEQYGERLMRVHHAILNASAGAVQSLSAEALLEQFTAPERFSLLRTT